MKPILKIIATFFVLVLIFLLQKPVFMLHYSAVYSGFSCQDWLSVMWHGIPMDMTVAGYLTVVPALLTIISALTGFDPRGKILNGYFFVVALLIAAIQLLDLLLYGYWGFKLDTTPLFYFATSPSAAFASATTMEMIGGTVGLVLLTALYFLTLRYTAGRIRVERIGNHRVLSAVGLLLLLTGLLFIPIRGGVTVSTMNLSRAYFCNVTALNHAAVNPAFSLLYSATHQKNFSRQFRFFDQERAEEIFTASLFTEPDSSYVQTQLLTADRPDVYIIILESFSSHLLPVQGGEPVALKLDSIARSGLLFNNFYASSFRTDRALPAILSGFPAQPTTSVMKFVEKAEHLPSIAATLGDHDYNLSYYYGGDVNFTNMLAYLRNSGFTRIVRDTDFPVAQRTGKWGAHDHLVFERLLADIAASTDTAPRFTVLQTSSSHEPFKVPYGNPRFEEGPLRAFAYTDSCVGAFVDSLSHTPRWNRSLVLLVPDHQGAYPKDFATAQERHHVPLILTGGALNLTGVVEIPMAQTDIAATLLGAMNLDYSAFKFSKNMFAPGVNPSAFYSNPEAVGMVTSADTVEIKLSTVDSTPPGQAETTAKAWLQTIYSELDKL